MRNFQPVLTSKESGSCLLDAFARNYRLDLRGNISYRNRSLEAIGIAPRGSNASSSLPDRLVRAGALMLPSQRPARIDGT
jgi:hypothetical protein